MATILAYILIPSLILIASAGVLFVYTKRVINIIVARVEENIQKSLINERKVLTQKVLSKQDVKNVTWPILRSESKKESINLYRQIEAYLRIKDLLGEETPYRLRGWALSPDALLEILEYIKKEKPKVIVELGSGASTKAISLLISNNKLKTKLISIDHDSFYLKETQNKVAPRKNVTFVHAPLKKVNGKTWYDMDAIAETLKKDKIDLLLVDGPPETTDTTARMPAVPLLLPWMAKRYAVFLDDAGRKDEDETVNEWLKIAPGLNAQFYQTEKGLSLLKTE